MLIKMNKNVHKLNAQNHIADNIVNYTTHQSKRLLNLFHFFYYFSISNLHMLPTVITNACRIRNRVVPCYAHICYTQSHMYVCFNCLLFCYITIVLNQFFVERLQFVYTFLRLFFYKTSIR